MICNVGGIDRTGRMVLGIALLLVGFLAPLAAVWKTVVFLVAAVALATAIFRFCPASYFLGINTCERR